jgi:polysaccharide export outer membrane protein
MRRRYWASPTLLFLVSLSGCGDKAIAPYPISDPPQKMDAAFGAGDTFDVRVYGEADLTGSYECGPDGAISFPLIGRVQCDGRLPAELEQDIRTRLADGFLRSPQVSVLPKEYRSKKVSVIGQVKQPGSFSYISNMSIIEAVARAGGFTGAARKNAVRVSRSANGKQISIIVAVEDIGRGKAPNFFLRPGDVVFVPERIL